MPYREVAADRFESRNHARNSRNGPPENRQHRSLARTISPCDRFGRIRRRGPSGDLLANYSGGRDATYVFVARK